MHFYVNLTLSDPARTQIWIVNTMLLLLFTGMNSTKMFVRSKMFVCSRTVADTCSHTQHLSSPSLLYSTPSTLVVSSLFLLYTSLFMITRNVMCCIWHSHVRIPFKNMHSPITTRQMWGAFCNNIVVTCHINIISSSEESFVHIFWRCLSPRIFLAFMTCVQVNHKNVSC